MTSSRPGDSLNMTSLTWKGGSALAVVVVLYWIAVWWRTPPAVEFDNLKYIQLLHTAVSSRRLDWVAKVRLAIDQRMEAGDMSETERAHFEKIITLAEDQKWSDANRLCFQFEEAQLNRRRQEPSGSHVHDHKHDHKHDQDQDHKHDHDQHVH